MKKPIAIGLTLGMVLTLVGSVFAAGPGIYQREAANGAVELSNLGGDEEDAHLVLEAPRPEVNPASATAIEPIVPQPLHQAPTRKSALCRRTRLPPLPWIPATPIRRECCKPVWRSTANRCSIRHCCPTEGRPILRFSDAI